MGAGPLAARDRGRKARGRRSVNVPASRRLADLGFAVAPGLAKLLDFVGVHETKEIGALGIFQLGEMLPDGGGGFAFMLEQPFRLDAMMMHALPLGTTGAGDVWLVSLAERRGRNDVFLFGHDTGSLEHVADSIEAFALAIHLGDREVPPTATERRALVGHVANNDDLDLTWLGKKRLAKTSSPTPRLREQTKDLRRTLNGYGRQPPAAATKLPARPLPAEALDAMLRAFLRVEDSTLHDLFARFSRSPGGLVRDAVSFLQELLAQGGPATFERRLSLLRAPAEKAAAAREAPSRTAPMKDRRPDRAAAAQAQFEAAVREAEAAQTRGDHRQAAAAFRRALKLAPKHARCWAALCYTLYCLKRWSEMLEAAKQAVALDPQSSYAHQQLACAYSGLEDYPGTIRAARRAVELDPKNAYAMYALAMGLLMRKKVEGRELLERACRLAPALRADAESDPDIIKALLALEG